MVKIKDSILDRTEALNTLPYSGQIELTLEHLNLGHRRIIEGHCKIIYRVNEELQVIYITDFFDSR